MRNVGADVILVSIRSPHRSKGRLHKQPRPALKDKFQSAPLTEARGDSTPSAQYGSLQSFNPLPSPKQGETEGGELSQYGMHVSIRSPHRSKGRLLPARGIGQWPQVSIRSPHRSKGRPGQGVRLCEGVRVSIRSPHRSKGRRSQVEPQGVRRKFQSAPLTEARGDAGCCNQRNTKKLHEWMREPPFICILLLKRELVPCCKLLLAIRLPTARK